MAESSRHLVSKHKSGKGKGLEVCFPSGDYRELEEAERLGSGMSAGAPGYSGGSAREASGGQSVSPSVQGSAGSRGSLLAPHTAKQVAVLLTRSSVPSILTVLWARRLSCMHTCMHHQGHHVWQSDFAASTQHWRLRL